MLVCIFAAVLLPHYAHMCCPKFVPSLGKNLSSKQYEQKPHLHAPQVIALPSTTGCCDFKQSWQHNCLCPPVTRCATCQVAIVVVQKGHLAARTLQGKNVVDDLEPVLVQFELLTASEIKARYYGKYTKFKVCTLELT